jgi:hypothetical protein
MAGGIFPGEKGPGLEADHFYLVPRLRMCGVIIPLPLTYSWRGAESTGIGQFNFYFSMLESALS